MFFISSSGGVSCWNFFRKSRNSWSWSDFYGLFLDFMLATFILSHNSEHKVDHLSVFQETVGPKCVYQNPKNRYWTLKATSRGYLGSPPVKKIRSNEGHYRLKNKPCLVLSRNLLVEITELFWNKQDCIHFFDILPAKTIPLFLVIFCKQLLKI